MYLDRVKGEFISDVNSCLGMKQKKSIMYICIYHFFKGEIRATGFNDVVDKFYEFLEVNKVCKTFAFI